MGRMVIDMEAKGTAKSETLSLDANTWKNPHQLWKLEERPSRQSRLLEV